MSWQISIAGAPFASFASINCCKLKRELRSQAVSTFSFTEAASQMDGPALGNNLDPVIIQWQPSMGPAVNYFQGRLTSIPRAGAPAGEERRYVVSDCWKDLERLVYQQKWNTITGFDESGNPNTAYEYRSEFILGVTIWVTILGAAQTSDQAMTAVLQWAIGCGAQLRIGQILAGTTPPPVPWKELKDMPCSEVMKELLKLTPDAVTAIDYTTEPPTIDIVRRAQCTPVALPFTGLAESIDLSPRWDLLRSQVVVRYVTTSESDGQPTTTTTVDAAGIPSPGSGTVDGLAFDALVSTVRLEGGNATFQKQPVQVQPIPVDGTEDGAVGWWWNNAAFLQLFTASRLSIVADSTSGQVIPASYDNLGNPLDLLGNGLDTDINDYQQHLVSGTLAKWMGVNAAKCTWKASFTYAFPETPDAESTVAALWFDPTETDGSGISVTITGTNAVSKVYEQLSSYTDPEPAPVGFAAVLYSALSTLHYEGTFTSIQSEVQPVNTIGTVLNITGSQQAAWSAMDALVQEIVDDLDQGRSTYKVGPPGHLTIQTLMAMLNYTRTRTGSTHQKEQQTGTPGNSEIDMPQATPGTDSIPPRSLGADYPWIDYIEDQAAGSGGSPAPTYEALLGFGASSFAGADEIDHSGPLEKLEISVGADGSGWTGSDHAATADQNVFSVISGDQTEGNDRLWLGVLDGGGNGGCIYLSPHDPSLKMSVNLSPSEDGTGDQFIHMDLSQMLFQMQGTDTSSCKLSLDSNNPLFTLYKQSSGSSNQSDENSLTITGQGDDDATIILTGHDGASVTIDTGDIAGLQAAFMQVQVCVDGVVKQAYVLMTSPS